MQVFPRADFNYCMHQISFANLFMLLGSIPKSNSKNIEGQSDHARPKSEIESQLEEAGF
jgi:hypothetical protein